MNLDIEIGTYLVAEETRPLITSIWQKAHPNVMTIQHNAMKIVACKKKKVIPAHLNGGCGSVAGSLPLNKLLSYDITLLHHKSMNFRWRAERKGD